MNILPNEFKDKLHTVNCYSNLLKIKGLDELFNLYSEEELKLIASAIFPKHSKDYLVPSFLDWVALQLIALKRKDKYAHYCETVLDLVYMRIPFEDVPLYITTYPEITKARLDLGR